MREGNLEAPERRPIDWRDPDFYDKEKLDKELRRVFDICHTCRRCFSLCDSFPRLFDLVDEAGDAEMDGVDSADFKQVVDACTLCDMCFMTKCPYVPPHEFDIDFPHLMLRYRAVEYRDGKVGAIDRALTQTDRNGRLAKLAPGIANWASDTKNKLTRPVLEKVAHIHREAHLPKYHGRTLVDRARAGIPAANPQAPAHGQRKALIYATCFGNYNNPDIGTATMQVLAHNGVALDVVYPECCGMPQLEQGNIERVAEKAKKVAAELRPRIDEGYDIVALVSSCALMMKFEWPLIVPEDDNVQTLAQAVFDVSEYVVEIAHAHGLVEGMRPLEGGVAMHLACHARAQNMGPKGAEMLRLIPETKVGVIERCSGHGGSWGVKTENFPVALKVGKPAVRQIGKVGARHVASECPLAAEHLMQGLERQGGEAPAVEPAVHPIQLMARAYGL